MSRLGVPLSALLLALWASPAEGATPPLDSRAEAALEQARARLAQDRAARFEARRALTAEIREAQAALDSARRARGDLQAELDRLERAQGDVIERAKDRARRIEALERDLRGLAQVTTAEPPSDLLGLEDAVARGLTARLDALAGAMQPRLTEEEVVDRSGRARTVTVVHLGRARAVALGGGPEDTGLLERPEDAMSPLRVAGAPLPGPAGAALAGFVARDGQGYLPLDLDGSLTRLAAAGPEPSWIEAGGAFVWPILLVGLLGLGLLVERAVTLGRDRPDPRLIERVHEALQRGAPERAWAVVSARRTGLERVLAEGLRHVHDSRDRREAALESALLGEEPRLERSLGLIAAAAGVAPLLGLLGTVTGMIGTFDVIAVHGTGNPSLLSGGISMALVTTQVGLVVAVPLLLGHALTSRAVERRQVLLEEARATVLGHVDENDAAALQAHLVREDEGQGEEDAA